MKVTDLLYMLVLLPFAISAEVNYLEGPTAGLSPTAKSFQRYGEIPVSLYTGTPNISVPLTTMKSGSLTVPVELSYHSGGVRADDRPGPTGLGWTLIAGGAITREKNDLPDELDERGYFIKHSYVSTFDRNPSRINEMISENGVTAIANFDLQPDKFSFNFPGYSGFFIMDTTGEWRVVCDRPLKVESYRLENPYFITVCSHNKIPAHNSKVITSFTLTGEDGTKYEFGTDAIDLNISIRTQNSASWETSAWYLKSITAPNGDTISYYYDRKEFIVNFSNVSHVTYVSDQNGATVATNIPDEYQGILISPVYLKQIKGKTLTFNLQYSRSKQLDYSLDDYQTRITPGKDIEAPVYVGEYNTTLSENSKIKWYQLDRIDCSDEGSRYLTVKFSYTSDTRYRLMLNDISLCGSDDKRYGKYSFSYHRPTMLPPYLSKQTDHWGYYNRCENNIDSPETTRLTDTVAVRFGSLREIVYPTGGKTVFEFEANSYSRIANHASAGSLMEVSDSIAGGLRIRRIINVPNDNTPVHTREFVYCKGYDSSRKHLKSSGILECQPEYSYKVPYPGNLTLTEMSDRPLSNTINSFGHHIGYTEVAEIDGSGGYTIRKFTSAQDPGYKDESPRSQSGPSRFLPVSGKAGFRGQLSAEYVYDSSDRLLRETGINYEVLGGYEKYVPAFFMQTTTCNLTDSPRGMIPFLQLSLYKIFKCSLRKTCETERIYEPGTDVPLIKKHHYRYNQDGQTVSDSTVTYRKGNTVTDVTATSYEWENNTGFASRFYKSYPRTTLTRHNGKFIMSRTYAYSMTGAAENTPYVSSITEDRPGSRPVTLYSCLEADPNGRPLLTRNADGLLKAYLWGTDGLYPVTEIAMADQSAYTILKNMNPNVTPVFSELHRLFGQLRQNLPGSMVTGYTYIPHLGVTSVTDPAGRTTRYDYDSFGRLCGIRDAEGNLVTAYGYSVATGENNATVSNDL